MAIWMLVGFTFGVVVDIVKEFIVKRRQNRRPPEVERKNAGFEIESNCQVWARIMDAQPDWA